jgi:putative transposase
MTYSLTETEHLYYNVAMSDTRVQRPTLKDTLPKMLRTYKYLLRPTQEQEQKLAFLLDQARRVYNTALEQRITAYQETGKGIHYPAQWTTFRDLRRSERDTLGQLNASALQQTLRKLDKAFAAFFRRVKSGDQPGFPHFKSRERFQSLEFTYGDGCRLLADEQGRRGLYVQHVGELRLCFHRALPEGAAIKHTVIKRKNDRWQVCLMLELPNSPPELAAFPVRGIGLDMGLQALVALSTGERVENPRWLRSSLAQLRILQRHASRQVKGSRRRKATLRQVARLHEHIANQRLDLQHQLSHRLVPDYDLIALEDLSLAFMNHNRHLSLSSHDAGWGGLRHMLEYKAEEAGIPVIPVDPFRTSQKCSGCGRLVKKTLAVRVHRCPFCGLVLDRDVNAARNILQLALDTLATPTARTRQAERNVTQRGVRALRSCPL